MRLEFTKMHGLGNDFIVVDATEKPFSLSAEQIRQLSHRNFGVGFDQLLVVERPTVAEAEFRYRIFNADGGEVEHCGNGARCFARFVRDRGMTDSRDILVQTARGNMRLLVGDDEWVQVNMGEPVFEPSALPFEAESAQLDYPLTLPDGKTLTIAAVSMGNPHAVLRVEGDLSTFDVANLGPAISHHTRFPRQVNAGFLSVLSPEKVHVRVFERGCGETLACGTGACAAVAAGRRWGLLAPRVEVQLTGGQLIIEWQGAGHPLYMSGSATRVFEGYLQL